MKKRIVIVLLVTRSIPLADGLSALLKTIPQIDEVGILGNFEAALQQIATGKRRIVLADLILLGNMPETALEKIHKLSPETKLIILTEEMQMWTHQPEEVLITRGSLPSVIAETVTKLLIPNKEKVNNRIINGDDICIAPSMLI